jgi:ubiquitin C-terminal hydrolase
MSGSLKGNVRPRRLLRLYLSPADCPSHVSCFFFQTPLSYREPQVKCLSCGAESNKRDVFMDLSLDISAATHSVSSALQAFIAPETLDGSNKYRCEKCKQLSRARKQMQILKAPNVLVIQLKVGRFPSRLMTAFFPSFVFVFRSLLLGAELLRDRK